MEAQERQRNYTEKMEDGARMIDSARKLKRDVRSESVKMRVKSKCAKKPTKNYGDC